MTQMINALKRKYHKTWMKLLKASAKKNIDKAYKHEQKLIQLELEIKNAKHSN